MPLTPTAGALRAFRGGVLAVTSATLAVAAHAAAGGDAPDTAAAVLLTVLLAGAGTALAGRRRGPLAILATLGVSQIALHVLLTGMAHTHHATATTTMTAAHAVAALLTGLVLARADAAVFAAAAVLGRLLPRRPRPFAASAPLWVAVPASRPGWIVTAADTGVWAGRGPPQGS